MDLEPAREAIASSVLDDSEKGLCLEIVEVLEGLRAKDGAFMTLSFFRDRVTVKDFGQIVHSLNYLSSFSKALLEPHAYIDDGDGPIVIEDEDFRAFLDEGYLVHPETGEELEDPARRVHLYYSLRAAR